MTHQNGVTTEGDGNIPFFFLGRGLQDLGESMLNRLG